MDKCDICRKPTAHQLLQKIETDWDGTYKMVCASCITERGRYAIECRFDKPRHLQDDTYKAKALPTPSASASDDVADDCPGQGDCNAHLDGHCVGDVPGCGYEQAIAPSPTPASESEPDDYQDTLSAAERELLAMFG